MGRLIDIGFDEPLDTAVIPGSARFMVTIGTEAAVLPASVNHTVGDNRSVTLTLASPAAQLKTVSIAYTDPSRQRRHERCGAGRRR